ncbi:MAG: carboxypeptidase-like regulatory domain-containing protein [Bacteroidia bacterium]
MHKAYFLFISLCLPLLAFSQKAQVSGTVKDAQNGEILPGTTILVEDMPGTGVIANDYGFYSLTLPQGRHTLVFQFVGYASLKKKLTFSQTQNSMLNSARRKLRSMRSWSMLKKGSEYQLQ